MDIFIYDQWLDPSPQEKRPVFIEATPCNYIVTWLTVAPKDF